MSDPTSPPPPPYEPSQLEFDQKLSHALEASTSDVRPLPNNSMEVDVWEDYDEAAFEAAFQEAKKRRLDAQSSTTETSTTAPLIQYTGIEKVDRPTTPSVQPLRIQKKTPSSSYPQQKQRPSWYAEARLGESSSLRALTVSNPSYDEVRSSHPAPSQQQFMSEHDEDDATAPPPFDPVGPDLEGPPFEEEERQQPVVVAYRGNESAPPSPLSSPQVMDSPLPSSSPPLSEHMPSPSSFQSEHILPSRTPQPRVHHHHSLPPPPRPSHRMGPRPATGYRPATNIMSQTRLGFDPSVAYTRPDNGTHSRTQESISINAAAFYNSAVSSHLSPSSSKPAPRANQAYLSPTDNRQSQYFPQQSSFQPGGLIYRNPSPAHPISQFSPYPPQQPPMQTPSSGVGQMQSYPPRPGHGDPQMRWATSEYQMSREFY